MLAHSYLLYSIKLMFESFSMVFMYMEKVLLMLLKSNMENIHMGACLSLRWEKSVLSSRANLSFRCSHCGWSGVLASRQREAQLGLSDQAD